MKDSDREYIFTEILKLTAILQKECLEICELIEFADDAQTIAKKVSSHEEDADTLIHELNYYYGETRLSEDNEGRALYLVADAIEGCTDLVEELAKDFVRFNVTSLKDNSVSDILNIERAASKLTELIVKLRRADKANSAYMDIIELDHFEVEAGKTYDINLTKLFRTEIDPVNVIKWQRIYESIYAVFDGYEKISEVCAKYNLTWG